MKKAYLTLHHGSRPLGTLYLELYDTDCPRTVQNFVGLLERHYRGCNFHRIIPGFMAQGGDFENGDGTGGHSVLNGGSPKFADENFLHGHRSAGVLSMANSGPDTNGSQFFITFRQTPHLDGKHVVFGHVNLQSSANVLKQLERIPTDSKNNRPRLPVTIVDCGVIDQNSQEHEIGNQAVNEQDDENEIDLEEADEQDDEEQGGENPIIGLGRDESQPSSEQIPKTKAEIMKLRLRKLKQKMNQARQLNKQAVREEGEKIVFSSATGGGKSSTQRTKSSFKHTATDNHTSGSMGTKISTETALESLRKARRRSEQNEINQYAINDYHNPEGQYRNYERNLKSLHAVASNSQKEANNNSLEIYNPLDHRINKKDEELQRQGAHRIATELNRRIEKVQKKERKRLAQEASESSVASAADGINKRNKRFNEKISRNYDKQTAEIRHNLERGTAL